MSKFTTHVTDDEGTLHDVFMTYEVELIAPINGDKPAHLGCLIRDVSCEIELTMDQYSQVDRECAEYAESLL